jgi:hypothetical protein
MFMALGKETRKMPDQKYFFAGISYKICLSRAPFFQGQPVERSGWFDAVWQYGIFLLHAYKTTRHNEMVWKITMLSTKWRGLTFDFQMSVWITASQCKHNERFI